MSQFSPNEINKVLKATKFTTDREEYAFVKLDRAEYKKVLKEISQITEDYVEVIYDKSELTLIVPMKEWKNKLASKLNFEKLEAPLAIITCDVSIPTVTGYLLALVQKLSPAGVSVFVQAAFTTDHIFVFHSDLDAALGILEKVKEQGIEV